MSYTHPHLNFVEKVALKHKGAITVTGEYVGSHSRVAVHCNECGHKWNPVATELVRESAIGCVECKKQRESEQDIPRNSGRNGRRKKTHAAFAREVSEIHDDKITLLGRYKDSQTRINCKCNECGYKFDQIPTLMVGSTSRGCPKCDNPKTKDVPRNGPLPKLVSNNDIVEVETASISVTPLDILNNRDGILDGIDTELETLWDRIEALEAKKAEIESLDMNTIAALARLQG